MWHWIAHHIGTDNGSGGFYLWWSGFGANLEAYIRDAIIVTIVLLHTNCHETGCWRLSRRRVTDPVTGEQVHRCHKHHLEWRNQQ